MAPDAEYRLVGLKDPVAALDVLEKRGVRAARAEKDGIVFVGERKDSPRVRAAARELGAAVKQTSGRARTIRADQYDKILKEYEQQKNLLAQPPTWKAALLPGLLPAASSSYAGNDRRRTQHIRRRSWSIPR
jgi:hypothetical protein